jgi:hypothetical protein
MPLPAIRWTSRCKLSRAPDVGVPAGRRRPFRRCSSSRAAPRRAERKRQTGSPERSRPALPLDTAITIGKGITPRLKAKALSGPGQRPARRFRCRCGRNAFDDFVAKTQARLTPEDGTDKGDQYVFLAIAGAAKAILSYRAGKRIQHHALGARLQVSELRDDVSAEGELRALGAGPEPGKPRPPKTVRPSKGVVLFKDAS